MRQKKKQKPVGSANTFSLTPPTKLPSKKNWKSSTAAATCRTQKQNRLISRSKRDIYMCHHLQIHVFRVPATKRDPFAKKWTPPDAKMQILCYKVARSAKPKLCVYLDRCVGSASLLPLPKFPLL